VLENDHGSGWNLRARRIIRMAAPFTRNGCLTYSPAIKPVVGNFEMPDKFIDDFHSYKPPLNLCISQPWLMTLEGRSKSV
jgi:hypothetical protein